MTELRHGMVIDVNLDPTQGSETGKIRPCIIVTNDIYNARVPVIQTVNLALTGLLRHQIPQVADFGLADAIDAAEALLDPVGIPGQVVIDHQVGALQTAVI